MCILEVFFFISDCIYIDKLEPTIIAHPNSLIVCNYQSQTINLNNGLPRNIEPIQKINTQLFSPIRYSSEFLNSYEVGLPLNIFRPGHEGVKDFYIDGNIFKGMSNKRLRGLNRNHLEDLPAIASYLVNLVKQENA